MVARKVLKSFPTLSKSATISAASSVAVFFAATGFGATFFRGLRADAPVLFFSSPAVVLEALLMAFPQNFLAT